MTYDQEAEWRHLWLENFFSLDRIVESIAGGCDKDCKSCTETDTRDCVLESREMILGIAVTLKDLLSTMLTLDLDRTGKEEEDEEDRRDNGEHMYG